MPLTASSTVSDEPFFAFMAHNLTGRVENDPIGKAARLARPPGLGLGRGTAGGCSGLLKSAEAGLPHSPKSGYCRPSSLQPQRLLPDAAGFGTYGDCVNQETNTSTSSPAISGSPVAALHPIRLLKRTDPYRLETTARRDCRCRPLL